MNKSRVFKLIWCILFITTTGCNNEKELEVAGRATAKLFDSESFTIGHESSIDTKYGKVRSLILTITNPQKIDSSYPEKEATSIAAKAFVDKLSDKRDFDVITIIIEKQTRSFTNTYLVSDIETLASYNRIGKQYLHEHEWDRRAISAFIDTVSFPEGGLNKIISAEEKIDSIYKTPLGETLVGFDFDHGESDEIVTLIVSSRYTNINVRRTIGISKKTGKICYVKIDE